MSNGVIAFLLGIGFGTWVYSKLYRSTGGNTQNALIAGGLCGVGAFVLALILLATFFKS